MVSTKKFNSRPLRARVRYLLRYKRVPRYADFRYASLREANLRHADFRGADLRYANLRHANLRHADLRGADLCHANLSHANLRHADLRGADLRGADLDFATWPLWCGSLNVRCDERLQRQLCAHALDTMRDKLGEFETFDEFLAWVNECHRVEDGSIEEFVANERRG